jgi:hypothetical protein
MRILLALYLVLFPALSPAQVINVRHRSAPASGPPTFGAALSHFVYLNGTSYSYVLPTIDTTGGKTLIFVSGGGHVGTNQCATWTATGSDGANTDTALVGPSPASTYSGTIYSCGVAFLFTHAHSSATYTITIHANASSSAVGHFTVQTFNPGGLTLATDGTPCSSGTTYGGSTQTCTAAMSPAAGELALILSGAYSYDTSAAMAVGSCCGAIPAGGTDVAILPEAREGPTRS